MLNSSPVDDRALSEIASEDRAQPNPSKFGSHGFSRVMTLAIVLAIEVLPITMLKHPWLRAKEFSLSAIFFFVTLLFFGRNKLRTVEWEIAPIDKRLVGLHVLLLGVFFSTNLYLLVATMRSWRTEAAMLAWYGALALIPVSLAAALFPLRKLLRVAAGLGSAWGFALGCGLLMFAVRTVLLLAWNAPNSGLGQAMQKVTFNGVHWILSRFYTELVFDQASVSLGTQNFTVLIAGVCSGIEGIALMLALTVGWLIFTRHELRLGRALLLVPVSLLVVFLLNMVRISALVALGDAGYDAVATSGFHSEAGWILFSAVAIGFLTLVNRVAWFRQQNAVVGGAPAAVGVSERNPAAIYLLPFIVLLGASLLSQASSAGFEWFYGLRLPAVLLVAWLYRREYDRIDWRFGWLGPAAGVGVFAFWIGLAHWHNLGDHGSRLAEGLAQLGRNQRVAWIVLRVITAVIAVPFAEELAFRGFIARRVMSADVENVSLQRLSIIAILASSLGFGLMHGELWLAGTLAGIAFCLVAKVKGRLGEAVAAHATANLMIAVWVLARGDYSLW